MAKILIVDDEPEILQLCVLTLRKEHTIVTAENGQDAVEKLKLDPPDLILLDVMLPGMDGYTLGLEISQDRDLSAIPVIVMTALSPAKSLFDKFTQVVDFLPKPFGMEELSAAVNKALAGPNKK